jgi:hypothetical protein
VVYQAARVTEMRDGRGEERDSLRGNASEAGPDASPIRSRTSGEGTVLDGELPGV